jgi:two-component system alkaline phosphatase synthesis response regulator PhoP
MSKILIIDDEREIVELLKFIFEKEGHEVIFAYDGNIGIEKAKEERPDLIILDIMMPGTDGYTVHLKLSQDDKTKNIPILVLTAKGQMRELFAMSKNIVAYIEKPFDPKILRAKVNEIIAKSP